VLLPELRKAIYNKAYEGNTFELIRDIEVLIREKAGWRNFIELNEKIFCPFQTSAEFSAKGN